MAIIFTASYEETPISIRPNPTLGYFVPVKSPNILFEEGWSPTSVEYREPRMMGVLNEGKTQVLVIDAAKQKVIVEPSSTWEGLMLGALSENTKDARWYLYEIEAEK